MKNQSCISFIMACNYFKTNRLEKVILNEKDEILSVYLCFSQKTADFLFNEIHPHKSNTWSFFRKVK